MFFKTQIGSINSNGVFDTAGRRLIFIGDLPVKVGDWVFSDGKYVFGNAPPKGSTVIFNDEPSGIPVLADNLRGYFSDNAAFKNYSIKGERWISNAEKTFAHDTDDADIIDAEIALDNNGKETGVYTVEKKIKDLSEIDDYNDTIYRISDGSRTMYSFSHELLALNYSGDYKALKPLITNIASADSDFFRRDDYLFRDCEIIIRKDGKEISTFNLNELLSDVEAQVRRNVNFIEIEPLVPQDYVSSRALLKNFKILPNGKWELLVLCEFWAERGFRYDNQSAKRGHVSIVRTVTETVLDETIIGKIIRHEATTEVSITKDPELIHEDRYASSMAHGNFLLKINSDGEYLTLGKRLISYPLYFAVQQYSGGCFDETDIFQGNYTPFSSGYIRFQWLIDSLHLEETALGGEFPGMMFIPWDGQYESFYAYTYNTWYGNTYDHIHEYTSFDYYTAESLYRFDSRLMDGAPDYDNPVNEFTEYFYFPVQDDFHVKLNSAAIDNPDADIDKWFLDGIFNSNQEKIIGENLPADNDALSWNFSFAKLKSGDFLFGIHADPERDIAGALFKFSKDGKFQSLDSGLKNFRLRQLKKISYAKR